MSSDRRRRRAGGGGLYRPSLAEIIELADCGTPAFAWGAGDGDNPTHGPDLTLIGSDVTPGQWTPYRTSEGPATCEVYGGSTSRDSATATDPDASNDIVVLAIFRSPKSTDHETIVGTRHSGAGWSLYTHIGVVNMQFYDGSTARYCQSAIAQDAWSTVIGIMDEDDDCWIHHNGGTAEGVLASPANACGSGEGIAIGARTNGTKDLDDDGAIVMTVAWYGDGIADAWDADLVEAVTWT